MIVYVLEKDKLYMMGKSFDKNKHTNIIIDISTIKEIEERNEENHHFNSEEFKEIFIQMFSISTEKAVEVEVEFDRTYDIEQKIRNLSKMRIQSKVCIKSDKIIYTDIIRGLGDFSNYLRRFALNCKVVKPAEFRKNDFFS